MFFVSSGVHRRDITDSPRARRRWPGSGVRWRARRTRPAAWLYWRRLGGLPTIVAAGCRRHRPRSWSGHPDRRPDRADAAGDRRRPGARAGRSRRSRDSLVAADPDEGHGRVPPTAYPASANCGRFECDTPVRTSMAAVRGGVGARQETAARYAACPACWKQSPRTLTSRDTCGHRRADVVTTASARRRRRCRCTREPAGALRRGSGRQVPARRGPCPRGSGCGRAVRRGLEGQAERFAPSRCRFSPVAPR